MKNFFTKIKDAIAYLCFGDDYGYVCGMLLGLALSVIVVIIYILT